MEVSYVNIKTVLEDYLDYTGEEFQLEESVILKKANDTVLKIINAEQLELRIARLDVKNYEAILPKGFRQVVQAMYRSSVARCVTREEVVEWTQKVWGTDCELKISLECPECHQDSCNCSTDVVIVDADRVWQDSHPEYYASKKYLHSFGSLDRTNANPCSEFRLMKRTSNNFFNVPYHVQGCVNINFDSAIEYEIALPKIVVNFKEGEILLSYLSVVMDSDGYNMIPDHPRVHEAIFHAIDEMMLYKKIRMGGMNNDRNLMNLYQLAGQKKNQAIMMARSAIMIPAPDKWNQFLQNHWKKFLPETLDRVEANLGRFSPDRYKYMPY